MLMKFEDTTKVDSPEGVQLELTLAGLGTRMIAQMLDWLIKLGVGLGLLLLLEPSRLGSTLLLVSLTLVSFFGYELFFETIWSGRTPGKRASRVRVVMADGSPVTFTAALVRSLLRIVDFLPTLYGLGAILVFVTSKNQRLGDLAAGTIVVREPKAVEAGLTTMLDHVSVPAGFDATAITQEQLAVARSYLLRRSTLSPEVADRLAKQIATDLRTVVMDPTGELADQRLIEVIVAAKSGVNRPR